MTMATFPLSISSSSLINSYTSSPFSSVVSPFHFFPPLSSHSRRFSRLFVSSTGISDAPQQHLIVDKSALVVNEAVSEDELWAAASLRIRTFNEFKEDSFGLEDHKKYLIEREFEALKERVAGKREGFKKFSNDEGCKVVVGSLDLNQCLRLPDEMTGMRPQGIGADFARAYLSNVCVAKELHRNGLGYALVSKAKSVAEKWGITDLYVHVAADNESAKQLYLKSGFIHESDEPAWQARFLNRPRRLILWFGLPNPYDL